MAFFVKITPPLTFSSSVALAGFVVNVVSVVSRNRILPKNRYLFLPSRKHVFRPLGSLVSIISKSRCRPLRLLFRPLKVLSHPPRFPCPSSSIISKSSPLLPDSRSRPLPSSSSEPKETAERHEAVPPFLVGVVCSKMEHDSFTGRSAK